MATSLDQYYDRIVYLNLAIYAVYFIIKYVIATILLCVFAAKCQKTVTPVEWMVFFVLGKLLGNKGGKIPSISLENNRKMSRNGQIMLLFIIVASSVVLAVGSALDISLFSASHICTEDLQIDCYPQLITGANAMGLNISDAIREPIQSCAFWNSEGVAERVTFICFEKAFNSDFFLVATGGLLALALYTMKTTIGCLLSIA